MITQTLDLNLIPGRVLPMVNVSQYDKDSRTLEFTIYNGDQSFDLTGLSAYIQGLKPDGHGFNYSANISAGKITADITEQMTAVSGRVMCEVIIMDGTDRIGTGNFILNVEAAAMPDNADMSASEYSYIEQLIEDAQSAAAEAAEEVEKSEAWAVGERGGVPVGSSDETYHNNSKYYAGQASGSATTASNASTSASSSATLSQSYAVGGTGTRTGENTDNASYYAGQAGTSSSNASAAATLSESYAIGGTNSRAGENTDNSKYYSQQASGSATTASNASTSASGSATLAESYAKGGTGTRSGENTDNAKYYNTEAGNSASSATSSANSAAGSKEDAEAWAVGTRNGSAVLPTDPTYQNNAYYWAQQASGAVNDMTGATATTPGAHGLVPAPAAGDQGKFLKGDGSWADVPNPSDMVGATASTPGTNGLVPAPSAGDQSKVLTGAGTWKDTRALTITKSSVSSLPQTVSNASITADMVVVESVLSNPSAQTGDWTVTTSAGSLTITGTISGTTDITLYLLESR